MHSQNFNASSYGSFYNNPRPKYYAPFPRAPNKFTTVNTFKKAPNKSFQTTYRSQTCVRPNIFTYVGRNVNPSMSKNNLLAKKDTLKPTLVVENINKLVHENKGNPSRIALSSKVASLKTLGQNCIKNQSIVEAPKSQNITQNVIFSIKGKTKSVPNISPMTGILPKCSSITIANSLTATTIHTTNASKMQPLLKNVVKQETFKDDAVTKTINNIFSPSSSSNVKHSLRSIENNFNLNTNNEKNVSILAEKRASIVSSKILNKSSTNILPSKFFVDKNSPVIKEGEQSLNKEQKPEFSNSLKRKTAIAVNIARSEIALKKLQNYKASLLAKKKSPIKGEKFIALNKHNNINKTAAQPPRKTNTFVKISPSLFSGVRKLTFNKYKVVNRNKFQQACLSGQVLPASINTVRSLIQIRNEKAIKDDQNAKDASAKAEPVIKKTLKQKISELKLIKTTDCIEYDLTDISPEELVSMDDSSLLQLSTKLKSVNNKRESLVSKSKYKLVSKKSSSKQAVRMIKAKYQSKNRKSPQQRNWNKHQLSILNKGAGYYPIPFKKGYRKHIRSRSQKFRSSQLSKHNRFKKTHFTVVDDIRYRVSRNKMTKTYRKSLSPKYTHNKNYPRIVIVQGERFRMDPSGKFLTKLSNCSIKIPVKRINLGGKTYLSVSTRNLIQTTSPQARNFASRVLHRSIQTAWASATKKDLKKRNVYCMFYNRFGKCNRGKDCPYVHDPSKIAVCTRFLRGTCKEKNCVFSHVETPGKMAICSYFLHGLCTNKECPYRHELLNPDAKLCRDFVRGYCPLGIKCIKAHILICPHYLQGQCEKGASCIYPHPPRKEKKENSELKIITCNEKICKQEDTVPKDESDDDDKADRYFDSTSFSSKETCKKREVDSVEQKTKKIKSFPCPPQRTKILDCPLYIPLSLDEDNH